MSMKQWWWLLAGMLCLALLLSVTAVEDKNRVKITCDPWFPWMEGREGDRPTGGMLVHITEAVFSRTDLRYEIRVFPFDRCLRQMQTGERDVMLMISKSPARERFMAFTDVVLSDPYYLYYSSERMPSFEWSAWQDLKHRRIGVVSGFYYGEDFKEAVKKYRIETVAAAQDIQNVKKLMAGQFDFIILSKASVLSLLKRYPEFAGKIKASKKVLYENHYPFGFSRKSSFLSSVPAINDAIREVQKDGTLEKILQEY